MPKKRAFFPQTIGTRIGSCLFELFFQYRKISYSGSWLCLGAIRLNKRGDPSFEREYLRGVVGEVRSSMLPIMETEI